VRDAAASSALNVWIRALERTSAIERSPRVTLPLVIERVAERSGSAPALVSREATLSFEGLTGLARRYSRWALTNGLGAGDVVCLLMGNCAEYLAVWLGLTRVGVTVALVNTGLAGEALRHAVNIVAPKHVIVDGERADAVAIVQSGLSSAPQVWTRETGRRGWLPLEEIHAQSGAPLDGGGYAAPSLDDRALYIYTSGTTGLPKAATVSHYRVMQWSHWFAGMMDTQADDRMYDCLPLYHSVGGVVATGATLISGGAVVLRPKFSASEFWTDVRDERCTLFQYIGELCRFLVNRPPDATERQHRLRLACGNGLRREVWDPFSERFRIGRILEYYAATEGNFSLYNCEGEPGSIGRIPPFLAHRLPVALARFDVEAGGPVRNAAGFCERCAPDETGEAIGLIAADNRSHAGRFEGYADADASAQKVLHDVFEKGDAWYRTGDLMRRDGRGFYYFVDRIGDTFRWKGENVSTLEVEEAIRACTAIEACVVYGVQVPNCDGRVGMAALVTCPEFDLARFQAELQARLPDFARPVFLRMIPALTTTGTFKPMREELRRVGFDSVRCADPIYVAERGAGYVKLDAALHTRILNGGVRL